MPNFMEIHSAVLEGQTDKRNVTGAVLHLLLVNALKKYEGSRRKDKEEPNASSI
jgi:hypothetical protein